jgi:hypothetical protein
VYQGQLTEARGSALVATEVEVVNLKSVDSNLRLGARVALQVGLYADSHNRDLVILDVDKAEELRWQLARAIRQARAVKAG